MRITKVNIPKDDKDGLDAIKMDRLGQVVLIAGKNGAGKTRILNKIITALDKKPTSSNLDDWKKTIASLQSNININKRKKQTFTSPSTGNYKDDIRINLEKIANIATTNKFDNNEITKNIEGDTNQVNLLESLMSWDKIETTEIAPFYPIFYFVPKSSELTDCNIFSKNALLEAAANIRQVGIDSLQTGSFAGIQVVQDKWHSATHQNSQVSESERIDAIVDYEKLNILISTFLNTPIKRTINDDATLFGLPLGKCQLSDGQKILLQFCMAIHSQEADLKDLILVMDEPENHLHPSVIIEIIDRLRQCVPDGQIWIATHSIPLLAHFDPSLIWFVENGKISHAGKTPGHVLSSLLGDESEIAKLQDFISLPAQFATSRYAFESLLDPAVVVTDSNDPQSRQIRKNLLSIASGGKLRILDFGAGKGRLISNIAEQDETQDEKLLDKIDYIAYDAYPDDKDLCENALTRAYGTCDKRYFNDFKGLLTAYDKASFDVVLMCNVLHEIDPNDWIKLFKTGGTISQLLKENGILLLVEDQQIPIGEKAYQKGFLVLDTPHLKDLYKIKETDKDFLIHDEKSDGRLKAHHIPKRCLVQIDAESKTAAIEALSDTAREEILKIRDMEKNYQNGKLHGFWTQQFANAQLNLAQLK